jgi:chromosome partitioning protein
MVGKEYRLTKDMRDTASALGLELAGTAMTLRQAYADAPGQRTVVWRMGYRERHAAQEIDSLFRELFPESLAAQGKVVSMKNKQGERARASARREK